MVCDWDDQKNIRNQRKHGIPFEIAVDALDDPYGLFLEDFLDDNGECDTNRFACLKGSCTSSHLPVERLRGLTWRGLFRSERL
jgi:uncharacterized DUF497 family protein